MIPGTPYDSTSCVVVTIFISGNKRTNARVHPCHRGFSISMTKFAISGVVYDSPETAAAACPNGVDYALRELSAITCLYPDMAENFRRALWEIGIHCDTAKMRKNYDPTGQLRNTASTTIKFRLV